MVKMEWVAGTQWNAGDAAGSQPDSSTWESELPSYAYLQAIHVIGNASAPQKCVVYLLTSRPRPDVKAQCEFISTSVDVLERSESSLEGHG